MEDRMLNKMMALLNHQEEKRQKERKEDMKIFEDQITRFGKTSTPSSPAVSASPSPSNSPSNSPSMTPTKRQCPSTQPLEDGEDGSIRCPLCPRTFKERGLRIHLAAKAHEDDKLFHYVLLATKDLCAFNCPLCLELVEVTYYNYATHLRKEHADFITRADALMNMIEKKARK